MNTGSGASRLGSQAGAWEPAASGIIQRIDRNDDRFRLSRQSTMSPENLLRNITPGEYK
jgi:hypothetical protein